MFFYIKLQKMDIIYGIINLLTINYHFTSKDELINIAVNKLIRDAADTYFQGVKNTVKAPRDRLIDVKLDLIIN